MMRSFFSVPGWRLVVRGVLVFLFQLSVGFAAAAPASPGVPPEYLPIFEAEYESPFAAFRGYHRTGRIPDPDSDVLFRIWKGEGSDFLSGHFHGSTQDCWSKDVHFCIYGAYMTFAAPPAGAEAHWSWRRGDDAFNFVSRQKTGFRGSLIDTITIRRIDTKFETDATYFVYSYDIGLIAFAEFRAEDIRPTEKRMPDILEHAMIVGSQDGLGGRENCKHWTCGALPQKR